MQTTFPISHLEIMSFFYTLNRFFEGLLFSPRWMQMHSSVFMSLWVSAVVNPGSRTYPGRLNPRRYVNTEKHQFRL